MKQVSCLDVTIAEYPDMCSVRTLPLHEMPPLPISRWQGRDGGLLSLRVPRETLGRRFKYWTTANI